MPSKKELERDLRVANRDLAATQKKYDEVCETLDEREEVIRLLAGRLKIEENYIGFDSWIGRDFDYKMLHEDLKSVDNVEGAKKRLKPKTTK